MGGFCAAELAGGGGGGGGGGVNGRLGDVAEFVTWAPEVTFILDCGDLCFLLSFLRLPFVVLDGSEGNSVCCCCCCLLADSAVLLFSFSIAKNFGGLSGS